MTEEQLFRESDSDLSRLARKISRRYHADWLAEDLKQEGMIVLPSAAPKYAPQTQAELWASASGAVKSAMLDYAAENCLHMRVPPKRVRLLRNVAAICARTDDVIPAIQDTLSLSARVALALYEEYRALFFPTVPDENAGSLESPERYVGEGPSPDGSLSRQPLQFSSRRAYGSGDGSGNQADFRSAEPAALA